MIDMLLAALDRWSLGKTMRDTEAARSKLQEMQVRSMEFSNYKFWFNEVNRKRGVRLGMVKTKPRAL